MPQELTTDGFIGPEINPSVISRLKVIDPDQVSGFIRDQKLDYLALYFANFESSFHNVKANLREKIINDTLSQNPQGSELKSAQKIIAEFSKREDLADRYGNLSKNEFRKTLTEKLTDDWIILETLLDGNTTPLGGKIRECFPEVAMIAELIKGENITTQDYAKSLNYPVATDFSLFEKAITRLVGQRLAGLVHNNYAEYNDTGLSKLNFAYESTLFSRLSKLGLNPFINAVVMHLDISKGGKPEYRKLAENILGLPLLRHNEASAIMTRSPLAIGQVDRPNGIIAALGVLDRINLPKPEKNLIYELGNQLIRYHGLAGQKVRGEVTGYVFSGLTDWVRINYKQLTSTFNHLSNGQINQESLPQTLTNLFHAINLVDCASVKPGLYTDDLRKQINAVENQFQSTITPNDKGKFNTGWDEIFALEAGSTREQHLAYLTKRMAKLRQEKIKSGEPLNLTINALKTLPAAVFEKFFDLSIHAQHWYTENATSEFSPENQVKIITLTMRMAEVSGIDTARNYDISFVKLMNQIRDNSGKYDFFKCKAIEVLLNRISWENLQDDPFVRNLSKNPGNSPISLSGFPTPMNKNFAQIDLDFIFTPEAKNAYAFFESALSADNINDPEKQKAINELYRKLGLSKDEWDRVTKQHDYLEGMQSKEALLDKNKIPEVFAADTKVVMSLGAGGGGAERNWAKELPPDGEILAIDISLENIEAMKMVMADEPRIRPILADAARLTETKDLTEYQGKVAVVVASAFFHEIYSYLGFDKNKGFIDPEKGREAVRKILSQSFKMLSPNGRLVIRDMMMPDHPDEMTTVVLGIEKDKEMNPRTFAEYFVDNFKGDLDRANLKKQISDLRNTGKWLPGAALQMTNAQAFEFIMHYSWHRSLPQESQEQYGLFPIGDYVNFINDVAVENGFKLKPVKIQSYLQPGYPEHLEGRVGLVEAEGKPLPYHPTTGLIVLEKTT